MCGIAGCYQQSDGDHLARVMSARMAHRGPDDHGWFDYRDERVAVQLAHRRLSIIDLSPAGHQPLRRGGMTISYNGELYNYRILREELAKSGVRFESTSDTEVVLEAWRAWGPACLQRFRGMFAFAIFDEVTGRLFLARDQLGIKPLHYLLRKDGLLFASELKSIVDAVGHELFIDRATLMASLLFYWIPPQRCAIAGVHKLPPGSWAEMGPDGHLSVRPYFNVNEVAAEAAEVDLGEEELRSVLEDSVRAHLVADVPVSTFLSGGLDSSIITVLAQRYEADLDAYTIAFRPEDNKLEAMPDDAAYARKVAQRYGVRLHEIDATPDMAQLLHTIVDVQDEPVGDPAAINTLLICQAARQAGVKVLLSGMGADELFAGYRKHLACLTAFRYRRLPRGLRRGVGTAVDRMPVEIGGRGLRYVRWAKRFMTFAELDEVEAFRRSYTLYDTDELIRLVGEQARGDVDLVMAEHDAVYEDTTLDDPVNRMCLADTRLFLPGLNLAYTDRSSMAASVEVRVPFVDPVVLKAAFSIAGKDKIRGRMAKAPLKAAASAWLPPEIVHRPKASFAVPLRAWVSRDLKRFVDDELVGGELIEGGFLDRSAVVALIDEDRSKREDRSKQIWQLLTLELWVRQMRHAGVSM